MRINLKAMPRYDAGLVAITIIAVVAFVFVVFSLSPSMSNGPQFSQLKYLSQAEDSLDFDNITRVPSGQWKPVTSPVNLGMHNETYWFSLLIPPTQSDEHRYVLHIDYPLIDNLDVGVYRSIGSTPVATYSAGDSQPLRLRPIKHVTPLFPLPLSAETQRVFIKVQTSGTIRLPISIWEEREFLSYSSGKSIALGIFFGVLVAMGVSNAFLTFAARNASFLYYSGYVLSLALTLATLHGFGYMYLWVDNAWLQSKSLLLFASSTIMFAAMFTRSLLPIREFSVKLDNITRSIAWIVGINIIAGFILPYSFMIKVYLLLLTLIVIYTLSLGVWLTLKGVVVARYFTIAWAFLLISGLSASLDNTNLIELPISSNSLLIIGGAVETLILALILAINYSHSREDLISAQQFALEQEKQANIAKEDLLEVQQRYQDDLEYKVEERTLELEITLRELSEVNQELERLNAIDPLTGVHNRRHFDKRLRSEGRRSRREQTPLSLAIIDVDHFKAVNDKYGHDGDNI